MTYLLYLLVEQQMTVLDTSALQTNHALPLCFCLETFLNRDAFTGEALEEDLCNEKLIKMK